MQVACLSALVWTLTTVGVALLGARRFEFCRKELLRARDDDVIVRLDGSRHEPSGVGEPVQRGFYAGEGFSALVLVHQINPTRAFRQHHGIARDEDACQRSRVERRSGAFALLAPLPGRRIAKDDPQVPLVVVTHADHSVALGVVGDLGAFVRGSRRLSGGVMVLMPPETAADGGSNDYD